MRSWLYNIDLTENAFGQIDSGLFLVLLYKTNLQYRRIDVLLAASLVSSCFFFSALFWAPDFLRLFGCGSLILEI